MLPISIRYISIDRRLNQKMSTTTKRTNLNTLNAIYDLRVSPASFDFITFLASAETERVNRGFEKIKLIILKSTSNDGFRIDNFRGQAQNIHFFYNVMLQSITLFPNINAFHYCELCELPAGINSSNVFPADWTISRPTEGHLARTFVQAKHNGRLVESLKVPNYAMEALDSFLYANKKEQIITLTMREIKRDDPEGKRSMKLDSWSKYFDFLLCNTHFVPVVVRDWSRMFDEKIFARAIESPIFSDNVAIRAALYERASLNFFKVNGTTTLSLFNQRSVTAVFFEPDSHAATAKEWYKSRYEMDHGDQFPGLNSNSLFYWGPDTFENIMSCHHALIERLNP